MHLRVFYFFLILKIMIINVFNRKITFITSFRSHCNCRNYDFHDVIKTQDFASQILLTDDVMEVDPELVESFVGRYSIYIYIVYTCLPATVESYYI